MLPFLFDMGLPMIFPAMYLMIVALGPIIFIEAFALRSLKLSLERTVVSVTVANFASTIIGIPVTWFLLFGVQMATGWAGTTNTGSFYDLFLSLTVQAPWVHPRGPEYDWIAYGAGLVLLVPFFFASWLVEFWVVMAIVKNVIEKALSPDEVRAKVKRAVRTANLASYALLAAFILIMLVVRLMRAS